VLAGSGTGKTGVLVERISHLVANKGVSPERILALTFSRRAADEMRARVTAGLPEAEKVEVRTRRLNHELPGPRPQKARSPHTGCRTAGAGGRRRRNHHVGGIFIIVGERGQVPRLALIEQQTHLPLPA
jgi:ATP-dependent exoDNAse (exonuclease V) beta subunit